VVCADTAQLPCRPLDEDLSIWAASRPVADIMQRVLVKAGTSRQADWSRSSRATWAHAQLVRQRAREGDV